MRIGVILLVCLAALLAVGADARSSEGVLQPGGGGAPVILPLGHPALVNIATTKATCPFIGSAVADGALKVYSSEAAPLASIAGVTALGNTGGGSLGYILQLFSNGNHAKMPNGAAAPAGFFSLDFPGSQGAHPGHSGILMGDPTVQNSGRWSQSNFDRLLRHANSQGLLTRTAVGSFIAENLRLDPKSKVLSGRLALSLVADVARVVGSLTVAVTKVITRGKKASAADIRAAATAITKVAGEENLVGSAGEFGLLFAFLKESPKSGQVNGENAVHVDDLRLMFLEKRLPANWQFWKKSATDWLTATTALTASAAKAYIKSK